MTKTCLVIWLFSFCIFSFVFIFFCGGCAKPASSGTKIDTASNQSRQEFQNLAEDRPPTSNTLFAMADIYAAQGMDSECEFILKRIIQENPRYFPAYNSLAEAQMRQGHIEAAVDSIQDGTRIKPDDAVLLNNLGVCRLVLGDYEEALEIFTKSAGIVPENARYRANMAMTLGLLGRYDESLSLYKQILPESQARDNVSILEKAGSGK